MSRRRLQHHRMRAELIDRAEVLERLEAYASAEKCWAKAAAHSQTDHGRRYCMDRLDQILKRRQLALLS
jgi:hypothetical protein